MSVGYDLAGVQAPNVRWYLDAMADASAFLPAYVDIVARRFPAVRDVDVPARISDSVTLSTMHGCPPDEIERISRHLLDERGLHTLVKCNPTLLGAERVRSIVNEELGWRDVPIPDEAFGHDLRYEDGVPMFHRLRAAARERGLVFGLKLSNTLEVRNWRRVFDRDATMYLSGRALHAVTVNLAATLADEFEGRLPLSFAGGADAFNVAPPAGRRPAHGDGLLRPAQDGRLPAPAAVPRTGRGSHAGRGRGGPRRPRAWHGDRGRVVGGWRTPAEARSPGCAAGSRRPWPRPRASTCGATPRRCGRTVAIAGTPTAPTAPRRSGCSVPSTASSRPAWTSARWTRPCPAT